MKVPQFAPKKRDFIQFDGGLDVVTPAVLIPPGYLRRALNYEGGVNGGYSRMVGYERFSGQPRPSDAAYAILNATITGGYLHGDTLTGATSGATGVIAAATSTYFVITKITGTYQAAENLNVGGPTIAVAGGAQTVDGAANAQLHAQYKKAAADIYRADIAAVPGSGSVLGVVNYNDVVYAFRNDAGGTAAVLYKSTASGWQAVTMFYELSFTAGNGAIPAEGATITKGAVSAVVKRVVLQSGSWSGGTAAGRFIVAAPTGGSFTAGAFTAGVTATCSGAESLITLLPGGRYEFDIANFTGSTSTRRVYGCSGVQRGFEFDGTVYVPITTGMSPDTPSFVKEHKKQLFFAFGASSQNSGVGTPYQWTPLSGAGEIAQGDTISGYMVQPGSDVSKGALAIVSRNKTSVLYGSSPSDFDLGTYSEEQGALPYTIQRVGGNTLMLDDRGVTTLTTTANYGNFLSATLSQRIQTYIAAQRTKIKASCVARDKNQYRLFFSDKTVLTFTFNGNKLRSIMPQELAHTVECIHSSEANDGSEVIYFGSSDGFVYQMEKGTSFDGQDIEAYLYLVFNASRNPRQIKHYKHGSLEVSGNGYAEFNIRYELGYASTDIPQPANQSAALSFAPVFWDAFTWDSFVWDGTALAPATFDMPGDAENVSLIIQSRSDYFSPLTFSGAFVEYIQRRGLR